MFFLSSDLYTFCFKKVCYWNNLWSCCNDAGLCVVEKIDLPGTDIHDHLMEWADDHELWAGNSSAPNDFSSWCKSSSENNLTYFHDAMMKKMYCKHVLFSKWNWFSLIPRKRWVTVAAERIRMDRLSLWGYPKFESANICNGFCTTSFITFQYLPISVKRMSKVVAISSVSLMHKPAAFTICAVQCCGRCCAHWPHLCVKGCGWTDRRERLDMAKKGVRLEVSKGWEEIPFDFWGVDLFCRYGEKWNRKNLSWIRFS